MSHRRRHHDHRWRSMWVMGELFGFSKKTQCWENEEQTYTKLLSDARLICCCCCCCCACCCCCCCWGCWETACCCCHVDTLVGNKPPGDARACKAVMSALVSWYSERGQRIKVTTFTDVFPEICFEFCFAVKIFLLPELLCSANLCCTLWAWRRRAAPVQGGSAWPQIPPVWWEFEPPELLLRAAARSARRGHRHVSHSRNKEPTLTGGLKPTWLISIM